MVQDGLDESLLQEDNSCDLQYTRILEALQAAQILHASQIRTEKARCASFAETVERLLGLQSVLCQAKGNDDEEELGLHH